MMHQGFLHSWGGELHAPREDGLAVHVGEGECNFQPADEWATI